MKHQNACFTCLELQFTNICKKDNISDQYLKGGRVSKHPFHWFCMRHYRSQSIHTTSRTLKHPGNLCCTSSPLVTQTYSCSLIRVLPFFLRLGTENGFLSRLPSRKHIQTILQWDSPAAPPLHHLTQQSLYLCPHSLAFQCFLTHSFRANKQITWHRQQAEAVESVTSDRVMNCSELTSQKDP